MSSKKRRIVGTRRFAKRLAAYGVGAGTALAVAGAAEAAVHFGTPSLLNPSPSNVINASQPSVLLDLDGDSQNDFRFSFQSGGYWRRLVLGAMNGQNAHVHSHYSGIVAKFGFSNWVGATQHLWGLSQALAGTSSGDGFGNFVGQHGYIGVRFEIPNDSNNIHYGWVEFQAAGNASQGEILGWAWEDVPEAAIRVGDTGAIPEPGHAALALLAIGAAGFAYRRWRNGKKS
jgi:hypothetical protein